MIHKATKYGGRAIHIACSADPIDRNSAKWKWSWRWVSCEACRMMIVDENRPDVWKMFKEEKLPQDLSEKQ